jgi:hypothetical protein
MIRAEIGLKNRQIIDFSLTSVTSSHVQIWKIVTKIVVAVKVL